jgi:sugar lactone lactonase YvrE
MVQAFGTTTDILGESPVWSETDASLYWVDIRGRQVRRCRYPDGVAESWAMPELTGSLALCDGGRLLVALETALVLFDPATGARAPITAPEMAVPRHRFNDGRCDRQGRFWCGSMNDVTRAPEGILYRTGRQHRSDPVVRGVRIPNGLAWSPDGRTMYFADSDVHTIFAYPFEPAAGTLGERRVFATTQAPAIPDGATVDADGFLWSATYDGWQVTRYAPDGRIDRVVPVPVRKPTSCAFGGPDRDILFVTTASQGLTPDERAAQPLAGSVLMLDPGVRGLPEPRFAA